LISRYKTDTEDGAFASFLLEFEGLLKLQGIDTSIGVSMSLFLPCFQSVFVSSIGFQACWLVSYYISIQNSYRKALRVIPIVEQIINALIGGGAVPCPLPWSFGADTAHDAILLG
jgi:hypothetical protein